MATLITATEVKNYGLTGAQINTALACRLIPQIEKMMFRENFGKVFYADLLADKIAYTPIPFSTGTPYTVGQFVLLNEIIYEVIQNTTGVEIPSQAISYYTVAPKFVNPLYNKLWQDYLAGILAIAVANEMLSSQSIKYDDNGVYRAEGDNYKAANVGEISLLKQSNYDIIKLSIKNMNDFILDNEADFPNYKLVLEKSNCCSKEGQSDYRANTVGIFIPTDNCTPPHINY